MAAKQTVVQNADGSQTIYVRPDIIGIFGEVIGCAGGILAGGFVGMQVAKAIGPVTTTGGFVGMQVAKAIGPVTTTIEKVGKTALVGSVGLATEYYVSEGISGTFDDISELSDWGAEKIRARSQRILEQAAGQPVPAEKQETKK